MTKLILPFRNFAIASKKTEVLLLRHILEAGIHFYSFFSLLQLLLLLLLPPLLLSIGGGGNSSSVVVV